MLFLNLYSAQAQAKREAGHTVGVHSFIVAHNLVWCGTGNQSIDTYTASHVRLLLVACL